MSRGQGCCQIPRNAQTHPDQRLRGPKSQGAKVERPWHGGERDLVRGSGDDTVQMPVLKTLLCSFNSINTRTPWTSGIVGELTLFDVEPFRETAVVKPGWHWPQRSQINPQNRKDRHRPTNAGMINFLSFLKIKLIN